MERRQARCLPPELFAPFPAQPSAANCWGQVTGQKTCVNTPPIADVKSPGSRRTSSTKAKSRIVRGDTPLPASHRAGHARQAPRQSLALSAAIRRCRQVTGPATHVKHQGEVSHCPRRYAAAGKSPGRPRTSSAKAKSRIVRGHSPLKAFGPHVAVGLGPGAEGLPGGEHGPQLVFRIPAGGYLLARLLTGGYLALCNAENADALLV